MEGFAANKICNAKRAKGNNEPSCTLREFAEDKGMSADVFQGLLVAHSDIKPHFKRGRFSYYHVSVLEKWFRENSSRFTG